MEKLKLSINWPIIGNDKIKNFLTKSLENDNLASSYIFSGPEDIGKNAIAAYFAQIILCQARSKSKALPCGECQSCKQFKKSKFHPNLFAVEKELDKKNISVEQIRKLITDLNLGSFYGDYKIAIVKSAEHLNQEAANALLKTLEEPKKNVVIIMTVVEKDQLPATLISRSQVLDFSLIKKDDIYESLIAEHEITRSGAKNIAWAAMGRPALAKKYVEEAEAWAKYQAQAKALLEVTGSNDLNFRLSKLSELIPAKDVDGSASEEALKIFKIWQSLVRDIFLTRLGHKDMVCHQFLREKLEKDFARLSNVDFIRLQRYIDSGVKMIFSNISPKLILEHVAINV